MKGAKESTDLRAAAAAYLAVFVTDEDDIDDGASMILGYAEDLSMDLENREARRQNNT